MLNHLRTLVLTLTGLICLLSSDYASAMYDPGAGRFLQRDPSGYPDGMNSYGAYHVLQDTLDPSGLCIIGDNTYQELEVDFEFTEVSLLLASGSDIDLIDDDSFFPRIRNPKPKSTTKMSSVASVMSRYDKLAQFALTAALNYEVIELHINAEITYKFHQILCVCDPDNPTSSDGIWQRTSPDQERTFTLNRDGRPRVYFPPRGVPDDLGNEQQFNNWSTQLEDNLTNAKDALFDRAWEEMNSLYGAIGDGI